MHQMTEEKKLIAFMGNLLIVMILAISLIILYFLNKELSVINKRIDTIEQKLP